MREVFHAGGFSSFARASETDEPRLRSEGIVITPSSLPEAADEVSDAELVDLALAAEPDPDLGDDAVSLWDLDRLDEPLLPAWYMPSPMIGARRLRGWRRRVAILIVVTFLLIDAAGLCSTYGSIVLA